MSDNKIDPKEIGVSNINFSIYTKGDGREEQFKKERLERGFDESETWSLFTTIASFIIPRLQAFRDIECCYPGDLPDMETWLSILDKMLTSFKLLKEKMWWQRTDDEEITIKEGLSLFVEHFTSLWW